MQFQLTRTTKEDYPLGDHLETISVSRPTLCPVFLDGKMDQPGVQLNYASHPAEHSDTKCQDLDVTRMQRL
jgi:hypothetical protein